MLDAAEPFLLGSRDQLAVAYKGRGGIGVKRIEAEDDHTITLLVSSGEQLPVLSHPGDQLANTLARPNRGHPIK